MRQISAGGDGWTPGTVAGVGISVLQRTEMPPGVGQALVGPPRRHDRREDWATVAAPWPQEKVADGWPPSLAFSMLEAVRIHTVANPGPPQP